MVIELCECVRFTRRQNGDCGAVTHQSPEFLGVGLYHIPRVVVHWDNAFGFHELDGPRGVFHAHREVVADRYKHEVDASRQELHLHRKRRIAAVIDGFPAYRHDHPAGIRRVLPGWIALDPATMEGRHELHLPKGKLMGSADVHGVAGRALFAAELRELERSDDRRAVALRQRNSVAEVIAMAMGEEDGIQPGQLVGADVCGGITSKEGIDDDALAVSLEDETGVSVECRFHSPICFAYASARSSPSNSLGFLIFTLIIQPLP